jgi:hypothetical protein
MPSLLLFAYVALTMQLHREPVIPNRDSLSSQGMPVFTDSLLWDWHIAMWRLSDSLVTYPQLQHTPGLERLLTLFELPPDTVDGDFITWRKVFGGTVDTVLALKSDGTPYFAVDSIARVISEHAALKEAVLAGHLTPTRFVAATSAIVQFMCVDRVYGQAWRQTKKLPVPDSRTLGQNLLFFWTDSTDSGKPKGPRNTYRVAYANRTFNVTRLALTQQRLVRHVDGYYPLEQVAKGDTTGVSRWDEP